MSTQTAQQIQPCNYLICLSSNSEHKDAGDYQIHKLSKCYFTLVRSFW